MDTKPAYVYCQQFQFSRARVADLDFTEKRFSGWRVCSFPKNKLVVKGVFGNHGNPTNWSAMCMY